VRRAGLAKGLTRETLPRSIIEIPVIVH